MVFDKKNIKKISIALLALFAQDLLLPSVSYAITGHDSMPEYRSFEPVATTDMVNLFNGSLTYNIPLLEVPNGYPINLSYHSSDVNNEALASWTGLGWNINPGAINRSKQGFPDEYKGKKVKYYNRMPSNWTVSAGAGIGAEFLGNQTIASASLGASIAYNNYNGVTNTITGGVGFAGVANLNLSYSAGKLGFSPSINPAAILSMAAEKMKKEKKTEAQNEDEKQEEKASEKKKRKISFKSASVGSFSVQKQANKDGGTSFSSSALDKVPQAYPTSIGEYTGKMMSLKFEAGINIPPISIEVIEPNVNGSFSIQKNIESSDRFVYGYLHSDEAISDKYNMMDYSTEMDKPFQKRSKTIGYPIPNFDIYNLSGEAMSGSFRPFRGDYGHYRRNYTRNENISVDVSGDVNMASIQSVSPVNIPIDAISSIGFSLGSNYNYSTIGAWEDYEVNSYRFRGDDEFEESNEKYFYRYSGDPAGYFDLTETSNGFSDDYYKPNLVSKVATGGLDFDNYEGHKTADYRSNLKQKKRSTHIVAHTLDDFSSSNQNQEGHKYKVFEKELYVVDPNGTSASLYDHASYGETEAVGEYITYNGDGVSYVYGLPVYIRNEKNLQYSFDVSDLADVPGSEGLVYDVTSSDNDSEAKRKLGSEDVNGKYPTTHLLTQILSPDYIDRTGDGPSQDDFGSYTKFNYKRVHGGTGNWYGYRTPYKGVSFNLGSLSDNKDDMGSFSYGEKEVYYLHSIESKTHIAFFSTSSRTDGLSANVLNSPDPDLLIKGVDGNSGQEELKKLDKIDLYALKNCSKANNVWSPNSSTFPIKTVKFDYNYELSEGIDNGSSGKLTLKKLWFENGGIAKSKISPYEFNYTYPDSPYPAPYDGTNKEELSYYSSLSQLEENPDYTPANTDRWGNYRDYSTLNSAGANGIGDLAKFWPYVDQHPDQETFDPAAYMLKNIKLPSGGEIHVQYEQNDYHYVQDKKAMVMVPLKLYDEQGNIATGQSEERSNVNGKKYYVDTEKIGIPFNNQLSDLEKTDITKQLFQPMSQRKDRIFFNFLYALVGENPNYKYGHSDYIEGYARVNTYGWDEKGIFFTFKGSPAIVGNGYSEDISYSAKASRWELPRMVCQEFYKTQRRMKIDGGSNAADLENKAEAGLAEDMANAFVNLVTNLAKTFEGKCKRFDPEMSYVRLQLPAGNYKEGRQVSSKYGGGVRVKRLLTYNPSNIGTQEVVYGNEYRYTTTVNEYGVERTISSGVATNEPSSGHRENSLVKPTPKENQSDWNAMLYGRDMYGEEGPIGNAFLPGPSVGYSNVRVIPIHQGITSTGTEEHTFYTAKDYPFLTKKSGIDELPLSDLPTSVAFEAFGVGLSFSYKAPHLVQGYSFISNGMHGKPKEVIKTASDDNNTEVYRQSFEYFKPGDLITVMGEDLQKRTVTFEELGREVEILSESRQVYDMTYSGEVEVDQTAGAFTLVTPIGTFPVPGWLSSDITLSGGVSINDYNTHVTSKIINYPTITKKVTTSSEGIRKVVENVVFDDNTGQVVVTKYQDDFTNGTYLDQNFMASWEYSNMESKYQNEGRIVLPPSGTQFIGGIDNFNKPYIEIVTAQGSTGCNVMDNFTSGDFIQVNMNPSTSSKLLFHINEIDFETSRLYVQASQHSDDPGFSGNIASLEIIRSGYTNQLNTSMGNTVYFSPDGNVSYFSQVQNYSTNHAFVTALNNYLGNFTSTYYNYNMPGTYSGIDVSSWEGLIPVGCRSNLTSATVQNIILDVIVEPGNVPVINIAFKEFDLVCDDNTTINIHCGEGAPN